MRVWYIHGANASPLSFNFVRSRMRAHHAVDIVYSNKVPLIDTVADLRRKAVLLGDEPLRIIGHSLGGVIAAAIAQVAQVEKIVTFASPFGGSSAATYLRWFSPSQLLTDIMPTSPVFTSLYRNPPTTKMLSFVTDPNITILGERCDGVVSIRSQTALKGPTYHTVGYNHFEVLLSPDVIHQTDQFLFE